jgi:hypothetical protein
MIRWPGVWWLTGLFLIGCLGWVGCRPTASDPSPLSNERSPYLLEAEPSDSIGVEAAFASLTSEEEVSRLTLVGRVPKESSLGMSPWGEDEATFVVVDTESEGHDRPGHDPDNCPFCKRRKAEGKTLVNSLALIQIVDADGRVLPHDPQSLLGLKENQVVVASGTARRDPLGNLILTAPGVFVRADRE